MQTFGASRCVLFSFRKQTDDERKARLRAEQERDSYVRISLVV